MTLLIESHVMKVIPVLIFIVCQILNAVMSQKTLYRLISGSLDDHVMEVPSISAEPVTMTVSVDQIYFVASNVHPVASVVQL